ncbi:hypothetical protein BC939DRAFT_513378 [Gamsiella multidivaricata]|uniref:uncharacterized protein n=1 Tax=Gamsiella multidivaricata TaxID=101098 RepID=UPI0022205441|nr:uncharacterized protein BC939DRAFT_513378 [Gamsiella multidivaricata]KAG0366581.1 hypothetical protein BGZ54_005163 [Gamsiella multidivaricata]KAI7827438.1 hypothetical protein BC939DRAFT_513378 [Gamsiella multidivaricata]
MAPKKTKVVTNSRGPCPVKGKASAQNRKAPAQIRPAANQGRKAPVQSQLDPNQDRKAKIRGLPVRRSCRLRGIADGMLGHIMLNRHLNKDLQAIEDLNPFPLPESVAASVLDVEIDGAPVSPASEEDLAADPASPTTVAAAHADPDPQDVAAIASAAPIEADTPAQLPADAAVPYSHSEAASAPVALPNITSSGSDLGRRTKLASIQANMECERTANTASPTASLGTAQSVESVATAASSPGNVAESVAAEGAEAATPASQPLLADDDASLDTPSFGLEPATVQTPQQPQAFSWDEVFASIGQPLIDDLDFWLDIPSYDGSLF